jgi:hypothetical protein
MQTAASLWLLTCLLVSGLLVTAMSSSAAMACELQRRRSRLVLWARRQLPAAVRAGVNQRT